MREAIEILIIVNINFILTLIIIIPHFPLKFNSKIHFYENSCSKQEAARFAIKRAVIKRMITAFCDRLLSRAAGADKLQQRLRRLICL